MVSSAGCQPATPSERDLAAKDVTMKALPNNNKPATHYVEAWNIKPYFREGKYFYSPYGLLFTNPKTIENLQFRHLMSQFFQHTQTIAIFKIRLK